MEKTRSKYAQSFIRDGHACVYCGKDLLESLDMFIMSNIDHLIPLAMNPEDPENVLNRVSSCGVCNALKHTFNPVDPGVKRINNEQERLAAIERAKAHIKYKRETGDGTQHVRNYNAWLKETGRAPKKRAEG